MKLVVFWDADYHSTPQYGRSLLNMLLMKYYFVISQDKSAFHRINLPTGQAD
jgi:hypothetical protein